MFVLLLQAEMAFRSLVSIPLFLLLSFVFLVNADECGIDVFCPEDPIFFNFTGESPVMVRFDGKEDLLLDDYFFKNRGLAKAIKIEFIETKITSISPLAFAGLDNLNMVTFIDNNLSTFPNEMFSQNQGMRKVFVRRNPNIHVSNVILKHMYLDELVMTECSLGGKLSSTSFSGMPSLSYLNISGNHIETLPDLVFLELGELEVLDMSRNELSSFVPDLFVNISLTELYLSRNPLHTLAGIELPDLLKLDVSYCKFESLDENTFVTFSNLIDLNLKTNRIHTIAPKALVSLRHLENLDLSDNHLHERLPVDLFSYNIVLETLRLGGNVDLREFGSFDAHMDHLYLLDLSDCGLERIVELKRYPTLARLILANNSLTQIPSGVISSKLKVLDLTGNQITRLDSIRFPRESTLSQLYLDRNPIHSVNPAALFRVPLRLLSLANCEMTKLWTERNTILKSLQRLIVSNNKLTSLSQQDMEIMPSLNSIQLDGNPLECNENFILWLESHSPAVSELLMKSVCGVYIDSELKSPQLDNDLLVNDLRDPVNTIGEDGDEEKIINVEKFNLDRFSSMYPEDDDDEDEIMIEQDPDRFSPPYLKENGWTTAATALITFAIVFSVALLAFSIARFTRRPQIPQRIMIGSRPSYHPLREDMNFPSTPISTRIDIKGVYPNETYKSTTYHHSKITPERS